MGTRREQGHLPMIVGAAVGAGLGLALGAGAYLSLEPVLESADGIVRELQGLAWNLVPGMTLGGGAVGWWVAARRRDGGGG